MRNLRLAKAHIERRRYCAVVIDYSNPGDALRRLRTTGRMYPTVYRARRDGWTKATRQECIEWIATHS